MKRISNRNTKRKRNQ